LSVTEELLRPLLSDAARPLITHYDDEFGSRIELSRATIANWAAKTANWLTEECDAEPGTVVAVDLPAHWQTVGVLLGAWWAGAHVTAQFEGSTVAFVRPTASAPGAAAIAVVALDPLGRGLPGEPAGDTLDYLNEIRPYGDVFQPWQPIGPQSPALLTYTVDTLVAAARLRAADLGITPGARVLSTLDWTLPEGLLDGLLAPLSVGASIVQCTPTTTPETLHSRANSERTTLTL
jgi:uncharacterized protein (TIGR03089 family)